MWHLAISKNSHQEKKTARNQSKGLGLTRSKATLRTAQLPLLATICIRRSKMLIKASSSRLSEAKKNSNQRRISLEISLASRRIFIAWVSARRRAKLLGTLGALPPLPKEEPIRTV